MKTTLTTSIFKRMAAVAITGLLITLPLFVSQCSPSYEEKRAENLPKIKAVLEKHRSRIEDYKTHLMKVRELLKPFDSTYISLTKLEPMLLTGNSGTPENLLYYSAKELDDPSMFVVSSDHYGIVSSDIFKNAIYLYTTNYLDVDYEEPDDLDKPLAEFSLDTYPYALIMQELTREKVELKGEGDYSGGNVELNVYLIDLRTNTVLGCELITAEPPDQISARYRSDERQEEVFERTIKKAVNAKVEEKIIAFLRNFNGFIYDEHREK